MKLLVDTSFIVSLFRENDSLHERAVQNKQILEEHDCYISNSILNEVITVLGMRTKDMSLVLGAYMFMNNRFKIINEYRIDEYNAEVVDIFVHVNSDKFNLSFVDSSLVLLTRMYGLDYLVTFDEGFKKIEDLPVFDLN